MSEERPLARSQSLSREHNWIPSTTIATLSDVVVRYLDGGHDIDAEVERLSASLARAAHDNSFTPERMLIAVRALWREFTFSQHDRLQLAALYDHIVKRTIDKYYQD